MPFIEDNSAPEPVEVELLEYEAKREPGFGLVLSSCFRTRIFQSRRSEQAHRGYICPDLPHSMGQAIGWSGQCQPLPYWSSCSRVRLANSYYDWFCPSRN